MKQINTVEEAQQITNAVEVKDLVPVQGQVIQLETDSLQLASSWEDFVTLWMTSKEIENLNQFFKGDIADKVGCKYGEQSLSKFADEVREPYQTIVAYRRVSRAFKSDSRALNLNWTHYLLASQTDEYNKATGVFESDNRVKWIEKAHDEGWSVNQLAVEIKKEKALIKESAYIYYSNYVEKIGNILMHMDINNLTTEQKDELTEKVYKIADDFDSYVRKEDFSGERTLELVNTDMKTYNTYEEAEEALKARKQKKGKFMVRHRNDGRWELVTEELLTKEIKENGIQD
jgi:translation elongation factor P/translation initiation factor 5A